MWLEILVAVVVGLWVVVMGVVLSLCRAAKRGDEAMEASSPDALAAGVEAGAPQWPTGRPLRTLSLNDAAALLGVSPETVLAWGEHFGFPTPSPSEGRYSNTELLALRASLADGLSVASAVNRAREQTRRRRPARVPGMADHRGGGLAS